MNVDEALRSRISVRAFKPDPVPESLVREILDVARWAPSGGNLQPWKVIAVAGQEQGAVSALGKRVFAEGPAGQIGDYPMYPEPLWEPYKGRRFQIGEDLYTLLGIPREDKAARLAQVTLNYNFFGAPVGLFIVLDHRFGHGQWAHVGMFMQSIALAAQARGLGTCMQEAWAVVRKSLGEHFALAPHEFVYCGMALGYPDETAPANQPRRRRAEVDDFTTFKGFEA